MLPKAAPGCRHHPLPPGVGQPGTDGSAGAARRQEAEPPLLASLRWENQSGRDGRCLGLPGGSRRVHEFFKGCWRLHRTHEVETEILICHYHQDPTFTLGWNNLERTVSLLRKNITINQASDRYICTCTHTRVLYAGVCIDIMCTHVSLIILKSMYIFFSPESLSHLKK